MVRIESDLVCFICFAVLGVVIGVVIIDLFLKKSIINKTTSEEKVYAAATVVGLVGFILFEVLGRELLPYVSIFFIFCSIGMVTRAFIINHSHGLLKTAD